MRSISIARISCLVSAFLVLYGMEHRSSTSSMLLATAVFRSSGISAANAQGLEETSADEGLKVNGEPVVHLKRNAKLRGEKPEFLSATVLPGRGMNLLQVRALIPGKGQVDVLASPSIEDAASTLNTEPPGAAGVLSFSLGGAFLVPYANRIRGELSSDGKTIVTKWNGRTLSLPGVWRGKKNPNAELHAIHGLILNRKADTIHVRNESDGQTVTGVIHADDFDHHWPSKTDVTITISLHSFDLDATVTAKNVGDEDEPMGIGWHPYFAFPSGNRNQVRLRIPASKLAEVNNYDDVFPTGRLTPVEGTRYDFSDPNGKPLNDIFLDDNFSGLARNARPISVALIDPEASYGLRIEGLSKEIRTIQVYAPPGKPYAAIEEQFNFADPFSSVWHGMYTGMVRLKPGEEVTWKVKLELFTPPRK